MNSKQRDIHEKDKTSKVKGFAYKCGEGCEEENILLLLILSHRYKLQEISPPL